MRWQSVLGQGAKLTNTPMGGCGEGWVLEGNKGREKCLQKSKVSRIAE